MEKETNNSNDALRGLLCRPERDILRPGAKTAIMERIREAERLAETNNRFEWILFGVFAVIFVAGFYAVDSLLFMGRGLRFIASLPETLSLPSLGLSEFPALFAEFPEISPSFVLIAVCVLILLFLDLLMRRFYSRRYSVDV